MNKKLDKLERKIKQATACNMSNAKWRKLFTCIGESGLKVLCSNWKFIDYDRLFYQVGLPTEDDLLEERLRDGRWEPILYKSIEFIVIPKLCDNPQQDPKRKLAMVTQPIEEIYRYLNSKAQFPIILSETELRIQAYEI